VPVVVHETDVLRDELPAADVLVANIELAVVETLLARRPGRVVVTSGYLAGERPHAEGGRYAIWSKTVVLRSDRQRRPTGLCHLLQDWTAPSSSEAGYRAARSQVTVCYKGRPATTGSGLRLCPQGDAH
jgi:hypothetical protein